MHVNGTILKLGHHLRGHHWAGASLDRWLAVGIVIVAGLMAIRWLPGGGPGIALCATVFLLLLLLQAWAAKRFYVRFKAEPPPARYQPGAPRFDPMDKYLLRATGLFEVEGKEKQFTELLAYFRSFETREHAVMAIVPPSSFMLFGNWPDHEIGMWYIFFKNRDLQRIVPGRLCFGQRERPALRLELEQEIQTESTPLDVWGGYRSGKPRKPKVRRLTVYLSFDDEPARARTLDNLVADAPGLLGGQAVVSRQA